MSTLAPPPVPITQLGLRGMTKPQGVFHPPRYPEKVARRHNVGFLLYGDVSETAFHIA